MKVLIIVLLAFIAFNSNSQIENKSSLELKEIMKGDEFIGHQPENISWSIDGKQIYFDWNPENNPLNSSYFFDLKNRNISRFDTTNYSNRIESVVESNQIEIYVKDGNLYQYDRKKSFETCILKSTGYCTNIQRWGDLVYFQISDDFLRYNIVSKTFEQIAAFSKSNESKTEEANYMEKQELDHFEFLKDLEEKSKYRKDNSLRYEGEIPTIYTNGKSYSNAQIDASGRYIIYRIYIASNAKGTNVPNFIGEDGQVHSISARAKVSDEDPDNELYIYDLQTQNCNKVDFSSITDIRKKPEYFKEYGDSDPIFDTDRKIVMHEIKWSPDGLRNIMDVRSYDNKDRWLVSINLSDGLVKEENHQHDEAWIGGPGISSWNMYPGNIGWIDNNTIYYQSEKTGYSHLYTLNLDSGESKALTHGNWEVHDVVLSKDKTKMYITTNETHPGNRGFYHLNVKTGSVTPILTNSGSFEVVVSPDESKLAFRYSYKNNPWELFYCDNKAGVTPIQITQSTTEEFRNYNWYDPAVITLKASDGVDVYARLYKPEDETKNKAAVIFVHGAGYLQNAHNYWSGYHREYMFHNLLRDNGFTVIDIDYRASAGYGRDYRTAIYRHMGGKDLSDQLVGKQYLVDSLGIDSDRIGIYGGSYGGFITLMGLLTEPGEFACGAALRSVTDWNHYNHEYTSNILNYPTTDSIAYYRSSPINFANNLEDPLIMLHGMVDDNVQFQDVVRLSQKFIELGKIDWELAVFPVEAHGFKRSDSWTDEYRRIYELFMKHLID